MHWWLWNMRICVETHTCLSLSYVWRHTFQGFVMLNSALMRCWVFASEIVTCRLIACLALNGVFVQIQPPLAPRDRMTIRNVAWLRSRMRVVYLCTSPATNRGHIYHRCLSSYFCSFPVFPIMLGLDIAESLDFCRATYECSTQENGLRCSNIVILHVNSSRIPASMRYLHAVLVILLKRNFNFLPVSSQVLFENTDWMHYKRFQIFVFWAWLLRWCPTVS